MNYIPLPLSFEFVWFTGGATVILFSFVEIRWWAILQKVANLEFVKMETCSTSITEAHGLCIR